MLPMGLLFILATAAPQSNIKPQSAQSNTCYTMRSYHFRRQDGQAPVPAGMTTCTPANVLQQRQVSRNQNSLFVPLTLQGDEKTGEAKPEQKK